MMLFEPTLDHSMNKKAIAFVILITVCLPFITTQIQCLYFDYKYLNKSRAYMNHYIYKKEFSTIVQNGNLDKSVCFSDSGRVVWCDWDRNQQMIMHDHWPLGFNTSFYYKYKKAKVDWIYTETLAPDLTF